MKQQIQSSKTPSQSKPLTPAEQLLIDKISLQEKCRRQEKKLNANFDYIRVNSSFLLTSTLSSLLFSPRRAKEKPEKQAVAIIDETSQSLDKALLSFDNLYLVAKSFAPIVWNIIQPMLVRWGISKVKSMIFGSPAKKNRTTTAKK